MAFAPPRQHDNEPFDPSKVIPSYSFESCVEQHSAGRSDVWVVIEQARGDADPIARCNSPQDAMLIADALNRR